MIDYEKSNNRTTLTGRTDGMDGRTDDAKTISLRLRRGITRGPRVLFETHIKVSVES